MRWPTSSTTATTRARRLWWSSAWRSPSPCRTWRARAAPRPACRRPRASPSCSTRPRRPGGARATPATRSGCRCWSRSAGTRTRRATAWSGTARRAPLWCQAFCPVAPAPPPAPAPAPIGDPRFASARTPSSGAPWSSPARSCPRCVRVRPRASSPTWTSCLSAAQAGAGPTSLPSAASRRTRRTPATGSPSTSARRPRSWSSATRTRT
mmetsp:Transcript_3677/g.10634  ORF Transcript_3677/g.10634 Transcript_3677/m.10634 type:complete len:209 (+) Transcript_3677:990-1616(+)